MFGTYRFFLACLVALSHFGLVVAGLNPGQWAVLSFYILSGFLMENQFQKLSAKGGISMFYMDRFLRIYPLFLTVLFIFALFDRVSVQTLAINTLLLPLNYSTLTHIPVIIPPSWSLACEFHFYLLVPLFAAASTTVIRWLASCSIAIFAISPFLPSSTFWAYYALPGILFSFISGILILRKDIKFLNILWIIFVVLFAFFAFLKMKFGHLPVGIHINVCTGYLIGLPIIRGLSKLPSRAGWDRNIGLLSYPLFLVHEFIPSLSEGHPTIQSKFSLLVLSIAASGLLVVLIEKPFDKIRYRIRKKVNS